MSPKQKIPTKSELLQLQRLYKTDEKIGERLGGVPAYLVAYWRRKKNIPKHSQPKFSEKEILNLWERYGDDDKCGLDLGISKAAFYNWRRRYSIKEKPAFLKLEQLELNFPGLKLNSISNSLYGKQTISQKILANLTELEKVEIGDEVEVEPNMVVSSLEVIKILENFNKLENELVWNPNKIFISLASNFGRDKNSNREVYLKIHEFVKRQGIKNIFERLEGSAYQVSLEQGFILPGQFVLGTDRYALSFGSLSALSYGISTEQAASVWASGKYSIKVPQTIRVDINGRRARGVYGKDIALSVVKQLKDVSVEGRAIEYYGNIVSQMSISERFTLCNLTLELGAVTAICSFDSVTRRYLTGRTQTPYNPFIADKNAEYAEIYQINIDQLLPQIALPKDPENIKAVSAIENLPIQLIVLGGEANGRFEDLRVAAEIVKGKKVNSTCRFMVYPASRTVYLEALKKGLIRVLVESGAAVIYPGYWPDEKGTFLANDEKGLATLNSRQVENLGCEKSNVYLCSPATAAASALNGAITDPSRYVK